jgi:hypothetical protein
MSRTTSHTRLGAGRSLPLVWRLASWWSDGPDGGAGRSVFTPPGIGHAVW